MYVLVDIIIIQHRVDFRSTISRLHLTLSKNNIRPKHGENNELKFVADSFSRGDS